MTQILTGVFVLIASPTDAVDERVAVADALGEWTAGSGRRQGVALIPWRWERNAVPILGGRPQEVINSQSVDRADVVVAFFDSRLGTSTGVDVSGTAEEIRRAHAQGKPVHVFFSNEPLPRDVDPRQLVKLRDFKNKLAKTGLLGQYDSPDHLAKQVVQALEHDIEMQAWAGSPAGPAPTAAGADLTWWHVQNKEPIGLDRRGKMQYRTTENRLYVRNEGTPATDLTFDVDGIDDLPFRLDGPRDPIDLPKNSERSWSLLPFRRGAVRVTARWSEGATRRSGEWTVTVPGHR